MPTIELAVRNMSCGSCVAAVTQALRRVEHVDDVDVDLRSGRVRVHVPDGSASRPTITTALVAALGAAGYPAVPAAEGAGADAVPTDIGSSQPAGKAVHGDPSGRRKGCCGGH